MSEVEDACRDYQSSLEDLTFNSKPHINMLAILAEENVQFATDIVTLIEAQIAKAPTTEKLPVMYLMDSIVKNVGRDYVAAFAKNLVPTFVNVFEKVDENTRKSLYKLRSTWDEIFLSKKLFVLDVRVNSIDPAWPVKPLPPNVNTASIHVNPKFLSKVKESSPSVPKPSTIPTSPITNEVHKQLSQEQLLRQQLLVKQKQLLELQQKKLELELEQTKTLLATSINSAPSKPQIPPEVPHLPVKALHPTTTHTEKNRISVPSQPHDQPQLPTRDPSLNRGGNQHSSHTKNPAHRRDLKSNVPGQLDCKSIKPLLNEKTNVPSKQEKASVLSRQEKNNFSKPEKTKGSEKQPKKETLQTEIKGKSKSPSPLKNKLPHAKDKSQSAEPTRDSDVGRRDPRIRKHVRDKTDVKEDETKESRKSTEKKEEHRLPGNRSKVVNGLVQKTESNVADFDKPTTKPGRNNNWNRSRSRSPKARSPPHSPKRRERRSPKRRQQSSSPIPSLLKIGKLRSPAGKPSHGEEFPSNVREDRNKRGLKIDARDNRRLKKTSEERQQDPSAPNFIKANSEPKQNVENWQGSKTNKRWKTGWEENKSSQNGDHHPGNRASYPRHRDSWPNKGVLSPRTPPHLQRFDIPGQPCQRFDGPLGHQTPPRFDGPMQVQQRFDGLLPQRFEGPNSQPRFDMPMGIQGPRFDNVNHPPVRHNAPPYGQTGPYGEPQNMFHAQPQRMQFQRPEQRFDMSQGPNFSAPPGPGVQCFPNQLPRTGPYFEDKNPQGPAFGNFNNMPVGNLHSNQQFPSLGGGMAQPASFNRDQPFVPPAQGPNPGVFVQNKPGSSLAFPENHLGQLDVNELFSKLISTGILKITKTEPRSTQPPEPRAQLPVPDEQTEEQDVPDLTSFAMEDLKKRYDSIINRLYTGIQCYSCGMRFTKSKMDVYRDHLDWHYRQNRTEKDVRKITHRRWYSSLTDWIEFEEIADLEERAKSQFFEEVILKTQEAAKEKEFQSVPAGPAGADEICDICQEQFEQYWDEEEEEWHLKNAMCVNEKMYHPSCYDDYKNTSSFMESTPSPSKTLLESPLSAMLNLVKEEPMESSDTVEEEPMEVSTTSAFLQK